LHLWQIRYIPIRRQKFIRISLQQGLMLLLGVWVGQGIPVSSSEANDQNSPVTSPTSAITTTQSLKTRDQAAAEFVARMHAALRSHSSVTADIEQTVSIAEQRFTLTGRYLAAGPKLRLEFAVKPNQGPEGSLIEVCDGEELWSQINLGKTKRVTRRDIHQIKTAIAAMKSVPDSVLVAELGLGGLTALFASLERTMAFNVIKEDVVRDRPRTVVQGHWKSDFVSQWKRKPNEPLPAYVPDVVRIIADSNTLFPDRIIYLKKQTEKSQKGYRALVSLQFTNVEIGEMIDEREFTYLPPEDIVPDDITRHYLEMLTKSDAETVDSVSAKPLPR